MKNAILFKGHYDKLTMYVVNPRTKVNKLKCIATKAVMNIKWNKHTNIYTHRYIHTQKKSGKEGRGSKEKIRQIKNN